MTVQVKTNPADVPDSIDLSSYEVVKRDAFSRKKHSMRDETAMLDGFADQWNRVMIFDFSRKSSVTFTKGCLDALGDPEYVLVLVHPEKKVLLLEKQEEDDRRHDRPKGIRVERNEEGAWVMEGCGAFLAKVADMMGWHPGRATTMLFSGKEKEGRVAFLLEDALMFTTGSADELADYIVNNAAGMTAD